MDRTSNTDKEHTVSTIQTAVENFLNEHFTEKFEGHTKTKDGREWDWSYRGRSVNDDVFIAIDRMDLADPADDGWNGSVELHARDKQTGGWGGGSCSVYGPGISYELEVKHAEVNYSSSSSGHHGIANARAGAEMIALAADLAEVWTQAATPAIEQAIVQRKRERAERTAAAARRREERQAAVAKVRTELERLGAIDADENANVRIELRGKKVPVTGKIESLDENGKFVIEVPFSANTRELHWSAITSIDVKAGGRYTNVYRAG